MVFTMGPLLRMTLPPFSPPRIFSCFRVYQIAQVMTGYSLAYQFNTAKLSTILSSSISVPEYQTTT